MLANVGRESDADDTVGDAEFGHRADVLDDTAPSVPCQHRVVDLKPRLADLAHASVRAFFEVRDGGGVEEKGGDTGEDNASTGEGGDVEVEGVGGQEEIGSRN